jgi:hypothetical protein
MSTTDVEALEREAHAALDEVDRQSFGGVSLGRTMQAIDALAAALRTAIADRDAARAEAAYMRDVAHSVCESLDFAAPEAWPMHLARLRNAVTAASPDATADTDTEGTT